MNGEPIRIWLLKDGISNREVLTDRGIGFYRCLGALPTAKLCAVRNLNGFYQPRPAFDVATQITSVDDLVKSQFFPQKCVLKVGVSHLLTL